MCKGFYGARKAKVKRDTTLFALLPQNHFTFNGPVIYSDFLQTGHKCNSPGQGINESSGPDSCICRLLAVIICSENTLVLGGEKAKCLNKIEKVIFYILFLLIRIYFNISIVKIIDTSFLNIYKGTCNRALVR